MSCNSIKSRIAVSIQDSIYVGSCLLCLDLSLFWTLSRKSGLCQECSITLPDFVSCFRYKSFIFSKFSNLALFFNSEERVSREHSVPYAANVLIPGFSTSVVSNDLSNTS